MEREISSRSANVNANLERHRGAGRMPPVSARIRSIDGWLRSNNCAIIWRESPCFQRSDINAFWLSV
jgi:hypothetical protein